MATTKMSLQDALAITERIVVGFEALNNLNEVLITAVNLEEDCRLLEVKKGTLQTEVAALQLQTKNLTASMQEKTKQAKDKFSTQTESYNQQIDALQTVIKNLESKKNTLDRDITKTETSREETFLAQLRSKESVIRQNILKTQEALQQEEEKLNKTRAALINIKETL